MTLYSVIAAALIRKVKALVAEYRKLVAEATAVEKNLVEKAETEVKKIYTEAKAAEVKIVTEVEAETSKLKNELIDKIAKL